MHYRVAHEYVLLRLAGSFRTSFCVYPNVRFRCEGSMSLRERLELVYVLAQVVLDDESDPFGKLDLVIATDLLQEGDPRRPRQLLCTQAGDECADVPVLRRDRARQLLDRRSLTPRRPI